MPSHDVNVRRVGWIVAGVGAGVLLSVGAVFLLLTHWQLDGGADRVQAPPAMPASAAMLQSAPQWDLSRYQQDKRERLQGSGWVDRERGIAHIPIAAAMELLARPATAAAAAASAASAAATATASAKESRP